MQLEVLGHTLDKEQTKAAMTTNTNSIIVAGAGSGKSLTMVGKIKYLVTVKNIKLEDILCITFTNDAANSLENKIKTELNQPNKVYTFHKLALEIIKSHHISYHIAEADLLDYLIEEIFSALPPSFYFQKYFLTKNYLTNLNFKNYKKTIARFIRLYISTYYDQSYFNKLINKASKKDIPHLLIIKKIYEMYLLEKKSQNIIDFDDMIYLATSLVKNKGINHKYKYIIIDEYQDTSPVRENLVKEIIHKTHAYLTVVGDDFQSIYRFSGCDLSSFLDFSQNFKPAQTLYLTNTYRNSQELINIAGSFIMANPRQIKKTLTSSKNIKKPLTILYYQNIHTALFKALEMINEPNLMILARNNNDIYDYISHQEVHNNSLKYKNYHIYFKTIHKSKGLEEDNILIINLTNEQNSLPSKIKDEHILKYIIKKDIYPYEEERRLFYVALTRTKNKCYLLVAKKNPSIFIKELIKKYKKYLDIYNL